MKYLLLNAALLFGITAFAQTENNPPQPNTISSTPKTNQSINPDLNPDEANEENEVTQAQLTLINKEINSERKKLDDFNNAFRTANAELNNIDSAVANYRESVLQYAGALLNIPYSDFIISEIGTPIFKNALNAGGKNTQLETTLTLLQNYKANTAELKNILQGYKTSIKLISGDGYPEWAEKTYVDFKFLPLVQQYKKAFPKSWGNTYLGEIINRLEEQLQFNDENAQKNTSNLLESLIKLL